MNIDDLFKGTGTQKSHSSWRVLVDSEDFNKMKLCNKLYSMFKTFSDNDFKKKFEIEFYSAFWEMDLACTLIESGFICRFRCIICQSPIFLLDETFNG